MIKIPLNRVNELIGVEVYPGLLFGLVPDINGELFIAELNQTECSLQWVKDLQPSNFIPVSNPFTL